MFITGGLTVATGVQLYLKAVYHNYYSKKHIPGVSSSLKPLSPDNLWNNPDVQSVTSKFLVATNLCTAIPAIFVLGPLGTLSDRKGRKRTLLISSGRTILSTLVLIFVSNFLETFGIYCYLIGPLIDGLTGGFYALSEAYATDCAHPIKKVRGIWMGIRSRNNVITETEEKRGERIVVDDENINDSNVNDSKDDDDEQMKKELISKSGL
ncbi:hypothetical protein C1646_672146 [Rhizophagus diaphanus]|nr:hypothetical protein C1646_672146 [Rhizophagus diaphanus] [Rhizophagus sp. MUCL 43196]